MNSILLLGVGWPVEPASETPYWLASVLAFIFAGAFVWLFRRTVGRSMGRRKRPQRPAGP